MLRAISGVILGYLVFGGSAFALFRLTHQDPHGQATMGFQLFSVVYGIMFAVAAGYVGSAIAGRHDLRVPWVIAAIVALGAVSSLVMVGISWSPVAAILFMAPAVVVGGWLQSGRAFPRK